MEIITHHGSVVGPALYRRGEIIVPVKKADPKATAVAALLPTDAVRDESGKKIVFLVKNERLERRAVAVGIAQGAQTEILSGLVVGDTVVLRGPANMQDGQAVQIKK